MRIAVEASCWWNRRGFGRFTVSLLRALVARDPAGVYTLLVDRDPAAGELPAGCAVVNPHPARRVTDAATADGRRSLGDMLAFTRAVHRLRPDVVFFPAVYSYFPLPPGTRAVVCFHDTIAESFPDSVFPTRVSRLAWTAKVRCALWQTTRVMTVSEASRQALVARFGIAEERVDVVTEGADAHFRPLAADAVEAALARHGIPRDLPYLLFVGGLSPHKNLLALLRAMRSVLRTRDVRLVLAGDLKADGFLDNSAALRAEAGADERLRARTTFTGSIPDDDLVALLGGAAALVLPSLAEGFGLPALEAMSCGTPVLASRAGSLPEVVGDAGLFFDPRDVDEMASRIHELLADPGLRAALAANARRQARLFTWERGAELAHASLARAAKAKET